MRSDYLRVAYRGRNRNITAYGTPRIFVDDAALDIEPSGPLYPARTDSHLSQGDPHRDPALVVARGDGMAGTVGAAKVEQRDRSAVAKEVAPPTLGVRRHHADDDNVTREPVVHRGLEAAPRFATRVADFDQVAADDSAENGDSGQTHRRLVEGVGDRVVEDAVGHARQASPGGVGRSVDICRQLYTLSRTVCL